MQQNINDEKEGNQPFKSNENEKNENNCQWKGKLTDLKNKHILKCATTNNPTFALNKKIKNLEQENIKLRTENNMKSDKIIEIRKELAAVKNKCVNMTLMYDEEKDKLLQEQEALNDVLMNDFVAKEKAAIKTPKHLKNIQKKQANEITKLKEINHYVVFVEQGF